MLVSELRESLNGLDDDVEVVVIGHFGEGVRIHGKTAIQHNIPVLESHWSTLTNQEKKTVLVMPFTDIGEEPW